MKIAKVETMKADAGWRDFSFLKLIDRRRACRLVRVQRGLRRVQCHHRLIAQFAELVIGMDPREVGNIVVSLRAITRMSIGGVNHEAIAAIENACLDIKAKALGVPVYALFGGPFRDSHQSLLVALRQLPRVAQGFLREGTRHAADRARSTTSRRSAPR